MLQNHEKLNQRAINLMIELRLHIKHNCLSKFKHNFWRMDYNKGRVIAVNYTGHTLEFDGTKFYGNYKFCIHKNRKSVDITNEKLYYIHGSYPVYSISSCLVEDTKKVKDTNYLWWKEEVVPVEILPYTKP